MWVTKFRLNNENDLHTLRTAKFEVDFFGYPLNLQKKGKFQEVVYAGLLQGEAQNKKQFLLDLKKDKRILEFEYEGDFAIMLARYPNYKKMEIFYSPKIIHIAPDLNSRDGWEYWQVASFDKNELKKLIGAAKKYYHGELFSLKHKKITGLQMAKLGLKLTEKQKSAFDLALQSGYYLFPRKTNLKKLAKKLNISRPTFEEHLRKAEGKIIPSISP